MPQERLYTREDIRSILKETYIMVYEEQPPRFDDQTKIFADLKADEPIGRVQALEWRSKSQFRESSFQSR